MKECPEECKRKVYLVKREGGYIDYDEDRGYVCIVDNSKEAREMGKSLNGDESKDVWTSEYVKVSIIGHTTRRKGIVLVDFNAG